MPKDPAFPPVNNLSPAQLDNITVSKKWILPPRPKPGRKPTSMVNSPEGENIEINEITEITEITDNTTMNNLEPTRSNSISNVLSLNPSLASTVVSSPNLSSSINSPHCLNSPNISISNLSSPSPIPINVNTNGELSPRERPVARLSKSPKKDKEIKKQQQSISKKKTIQLDCSIIHNPIKQEILKINEENYYLKLEVIRLVSNLKSIREEISTTKKNENENGNDVAIDNKSIKNNVKNNTTTEIPPTSTNDNNIKEKNNKSSTLKNNEEKQNFKPPIEPHINKIPDKVNSKKRSHDDDINDLIVSLIDLTHSQQTKLDNNSITINETQNENNEKDNGKNNEQNNKKSNEKNNETKNEINENNSNNNEQTNIIPDINMKNISITSIDNNESITPMTLIETTTNSPINKLIYEEDDFDLLSTVSTTNSTVFSSSQSISNETIDTLSYSNHLHSNNNNNNNASTLDNIDEIPAFQLLDLPNDLSIKNGKMNIQYNYEIPLIDDLNNNDKQFNLLDTFSLVKENNNKFEDLSTLKLLDFNENLLNYNENDMNEFNDINDINDIDGINNGQSSTITFNNENDVEMEFENFVNGTIF